MDERLNFTEVAALVVDPDRYSIGIVSQILRGFGLRDLTTVTSGEDAKKCLASDRFDILITENMLPDIPLPELVAWVRRHKSTKLRYIPIVVLTGYTSFSRVAGARDSGVNSVVRKPVAPTVLFDHIAWSAKTDRPFIDADQYTGPCRRFRFGEPAPGLNRRVTDRPFEPFAAHQADDKTAQEDVN